MKNIKMLFLLLFIATLTTCGQQKKYISYTVKQGETIKSIAKENGLKTKVLLRLNPDVSKKPKPNTVIIIPNKSYAANQGVDDGFHTVQKKETLFSIAQKYGVTVDAIKEINNLTGDNLSAGRIIQIPTKTETETETEIEVVEVTAEVVDPNAIMHLVVKDDTVYNLTKKYNISEEELFEMNPALKDGLNLGMNIKIGEKSSEEIERNLNLFADEITDKPLNIVLMLPYKLNSIAIDNPAFKWNNSLLNIVTDFHAGALIAIDSLRKQGMSITIDVIDTQNSSNKIASILRNYNFENVDVIVGPLFLKNAKQVSKAVEIPVIAPMYSKNQAFISDANLVKVAPNKILLEEKLLNYLLESYDGEKVIIVGDNSNASSSKVNQLLAKLRANTINDITILKPKDGYISKKRFIKVIDALQKNNWVILASDDNIVTADVVNNLGVMPYEKRVIRLFGFNKGANFKTVSNNQLARLSYTFPAVEFTDVSSAELRIFQKMYKSKNHVRPSVFATRGFDVTYDALMRLSNSDDFNEGAKLGVSERVITKFDYSKKLFGSTENNGVFLIQYQENLELISID